MLEKRTIGTDDSKEVLTRHVYSNHLQSASLELDETAAIVSYEEYHPYGTTAFQAKSATINAVAKRYQYTGKERDEESGLYYHGARYYIPWLCRWTAIDPMESKYAGMSPYNYSFNNPIMWNDLSGADPGIGDDDPKVPKGVRNGGVAGGYTGGRSETVLHKASPRSSKKSVSATKQPEFRLPTEAEWDKISPTPKMYTIVDSYDRRPDYVPSEKNNELTAAELFKYNALEEFTLTPFVALANNKRKAVAMLKGEPTYDRYIVEAIANDGTEILLLHRYIKASIYDEPKQLLNNLDAIGLIGGGPGGTLIAKTPVNPSTVISATTEVISLVKQDEKLLKLAKETFEGNDLLRKEANSLIQQLTNGNMNPGIGSKNIGKNIFEARTKGGARVYFRNNQSKGIDIIGYSNKSNQQQVINRILEVFK